MDFIDGADLLIADGQYTEEEYPGKVGWGHSSIPVLIDVALRAGVKQLAIFHHDPQHSDKFLDDQWTRYRSGGSQGKHTMDLFWAREGMTLAV
jgi:ribonuclease BN (tRNA processing enzyme)